MADPFVDRVLALLARFRGPGPLRELFWTELEYPHAAETLSRRAWPEEASAALAEDPQLLSRAGEDGRFHVVYARLAGSRLSRSAERQVLGQLLPDHPYALFVFSNREQDAWHLVNVKVTAADAEHAHDAAARRRQVRRIAIVPGEPMRTAGERIAMLRLDGGGAGPDSPPLALQELHDRAFDVERVTRDFYDEYRRVFEEVEGQIRGFEGDDDARRLFTQRLFNRLLFATFVQKKGWLEFGGSRDYFRALWADYQAFRSEEPGEETNFYRDRLQLLFHAVFHGKLDYRPSASQGWVQMLVGTGPYLNGGLFEEKELERRPGIFVPDAAMQRVLEGLIHRFNFTITEASPAEVEVAVDPEMLGKVFEELVTTRKGIGSYFTPKLIVAFMCREALKGYLRTALPQEAPAAIARFVDEHDAAALHDGEAVLQALREVKVCDPACGSGAYLLGMLQELLDLRGALFATRGVGAVSAYERKLEIIQNNIYGADITEFAVDIARMRLWLSLMVDYEPTEGSDWVPPLPNLDFKIERGDSLSFPAPEHQGLAGEVVERLRVLKGEYLTAHGPEMDRIRDEIAALKRDLAGWGGMDAKGDAFDWWVEFAEVFVDRPAPGRAGDRPGGFDIILANPPYGADVEDHVRDLYFGPGASKDTYGLFVARGLDLLRPSGYLSYIISDTWRTLRTHRPLRLRLLRDTEVFHVLDLPDWIFDATVNTCILNLRRDGAGPDHALTAGDLRAVPDAAWLPLGVNLAALSAAGPDVQTAAFARYTYPQSRIRLSENVPFFIGSPALFQKSFGAGLPKLGELAEVRVGLQTGDNPKYVRKAPGARGGYALVEPARVLRADELAALSPEEKRDGVDPARYGGRSFVPYDKGGESAAGEGWLPNYHVPTAYFIDWSRAAVHRMRTVTVAEVDRGRKKKEKKARKGDDKKIASRFQNAEFYFRAGITFSDSGVYAPTFRRSAGSVFDQKGSVIVPAEGVDRDLLLGILCSRWARYVYKTFVNHTVSIHVDSIKELPVQLHGRETARIAELVRTVMARQEAEPRYPYHLHEQVEIDALVYSLYGVTAAEVQEVELWYRRRYASLAGAGDAAGESPPQARAA